MNVCDIGEMKPLVYNPPTGQLKIIHRDVDILLVDKPAGLLSVPGKAAEHSDCLEMRVKGAFPEALLVHRLDMDTSGVMVFAMNRVSQRHLGLQFEKRYIEKCYVAYVSGDVLGQSGEIDLPLIADWPNRPLQKVCFENGKRALTRWSVIDRSKGFTRLKLQPKTGRSHQLRVHMQAIGHPILGDRFYGCDADVAASDRLMLHSESLVLFHPTGGERRIFTAPCPF